MKITVKNGHSNLRNLIVVSKDGLRTCWSLVSDIKVESEDSITVFFNGKGNYIKVDNVYSVLFEEMQTNPLGY